MSQASSALVCEQRPTLLRLLATALRTGKLADLRKYLAQQGDPSAVTWYDPAGRSFYAVQSDHTGQGDLRRATLLTAFSVDSSKEHVMALIRAGADVNGGSRQATARSTMQL